MAVLVVRGETIEADALFAQIDARNQRAELRKVRLPMLWVALTFARRGRLDDARAALDGLAESIWQGRSLVARAAIVVAGDVWDEAASLSAELRELADRRLLYLLPHYADRLDGQAALAADDLQPAATALAVSAGGFAALGAIWEAALSSLLHGEALAAAGRSPEAEPVLHHAAAVFARVGAPRERATAEALIGSLR